MKRYVDGYILPIKANGLKAYEKMASLGAKVWMKHGALAYFECVGEDMNPNMGGQKIASFEKSLKIKADEKVIFAFVIYKSRAHRDRVNKKVMNDPEMCPEQFQDFVMPFDPKKMLYAGFESLVAYP